MAGSYPYLPFRVDGVCYAVPMDYVAYVVSSTDHFPYCTPPGRSAYVDRVMSIKEKLIAIVSLSQHEAEKTRNQTDSMKPLILILNYRESMIGISADQIGPPLEFSEAEVEKTLNNKSVSLIYDEEHFILFDVPQFYSEIGMR